MNILAIETSCDETSAAVVQADPVGLKTAIRSNIVSSQVKIHAQWGGVVPNLAAREHLKNFPVVIRQALENASLTLRDIDLVAVTQGPGLIPALLIGTNAAKTLSYCHNKPLIGIHHIEGHIYANFVEQIPAFPALCLVVSGGHTQLVKIENHGQYEILGQTLDDAAGEAFDKVGKLLDLGYPGGPIVSRRAAAARDGLDKGDEKLADIYKAISFPRPLLSQPNLDFSFSGLKTAVLYFFRELEKKYADNDKNIPQILTLEQWKDLVCLAFEEAVVDVLVKKTVRAAEKFQPKTVMLAGGVAANARLRSKMADAIGKIDPSPTYIIPPLELCGDNAAMIGIAAFFRHQKLKSDHQLTLLDDNWKKLEANANWLLQ